jgi:hypothetical protein
MGWRGTMVLALALFLAAAYAYVDLSRDGEISLDTVLGLTRPTPPGSEANRLLAFRPDEIVAVEIRWSEREARIRRSAASGSGGARPEAIDDFLAAVLELSEILVLDVRPDELADYGLDPPRGTVVLRRASGAPLTLEIGNHNPSATGVYARVGATSRVILTGAVVLWEVEKMIKATADN